MSTFEKCHDMSARTYVHTHHTRTYNYTLRYSTVCTARTYGVDGTNTVDCAFVPSLRHKHTLQHVRHTSVRAVQNSTVCDASLHNTLIDTTHRPDRVLRQYRRYYCLHTQKTTEELTVPCPSHFQTSQKAALLTTLYGHSVPCHFVGKRR